MGPSTRSTPHLESHCLPPTGQARAVLQQELHRQQPLKHAAPVAKQLLHIAINATASTVARHLTDLGYEATTLRSQRKFEPLPRPRASTSARNRQLAGSTTPRATATSSTYKAQATLARLHQEALAKLQLSPDDHPFLLIQNHHDAYNNIVQQLPAAPPGIQHTLEAAIKAVNLTTLRQATPTSHTYTRDARPKPTTYATLEAYFRRTAK